MLGFAPLSNNALSSVSEQTADVVGTLNTTLDEFSCNADGTVSNSIGGGFDVILLRNANRNNILMGAYPNGDAPPFVGAGDPIILFSDLISAPRAGWSAAEPNKGAAISLWGFNFGTFNQGTTYVTVGGVNITATSDIPTWAETGLNPHLQKITFYLNSSVPLGDQTITITSGGSTSIQTIPIKVTANNIYFADSAAVGGTGTLVDPWENPLNFTKDASPGDILYLRAGTFTDEIDGGNSVFYIRTGSPTPANDASHGTVTDPIAICGYPSETATINAPDIIGGNTWRGISCKNNYWTFSNMTVTSTGLGIDAGGTDNGRGIRVVGCDVKGVQSSGDFAGHIITNGSDHRVYGNYCHGGRSNDALDHAIYISGDAGDGGAEVGYNYVVDNDFDTGAQIVLNHQDARIPTDKFCKSHYVYGNFVDASAFPAVCLSCYDLSWDDGVDTAGEPEPAYFYNNITISGGADRNTPALSAWGAHSKWYNNTTYDCVGTGMEIANARVISCEMKNNIFHMQTGHTFEYIREINLSGATVDIDTNVYYNSTGGLTDPLVADPNGVETNPEIVVDLLNATITQGTWTQTAGIEVPFVTNNYDAVDKAGVYSLGAL